MLQNSEPAIACEVAHDENEKAFCASDIYLLNNYTRSALLDAMRGRRYWNLVPHLMTGAVARKETSVQSDWGPSCSFYKLNRTLEKF